MNRSACKGLADALALNTRHEEIAASIAPEE